MKKESKLLKALIVDDNQNDANLLNIYLDNYLSDLLEVTHIAHNIKDARNALENSNFDIAYFDIELKETYTIFDFPEIIENFDGITILVSSHQHYSIKALNSGKITSYILKPYCEKELNSLTRQAINRHRVELVKAANKKPSHDVSSFISISSSKKVEIIRLNEIIFLESKGRYTIFYLKNGETKMACKNIGQYEGILQKTSSVFYRIHNRYVINVNKLNCYMSGYCKLEGINNALPVSKNKKEALMDYLYSRN